MLPAEQGDSALHGSALLSEQARLVGDTEKSSQRVRGINNRMEFMVLNPIGPE